MKHKIVLLSSLCALMSIGSHAQSTATSYTATDATVQNGTYHYKLSNGTAATQVRWAIGMIETETGSNKGSNFRISRMDDSGNWIANAFAINRATGLVEMYSGFRAPYGSGITGNNTGVVNLSFMGFYESDGTTRQGYVGKGSGASSDTYLGSDIAGISLFATDGMINLKNASNNMINFGNAGNGAPTINARSAGTKIILANAVNPSTSNADYAIGTEFSNSATHGWFSVPTNQTVHYWSFYGGTVPVAKLDGMGNFSTVGSVVVGSTSTVATLKVNGDITARKLKVTQSGWPDYVFAADYQLPSLQEISNYIKANHHLPNVPAAEEIEKNGVDVGEMQKTMMQKIEELTLHLIRLDEENRQLKAELEKLKSAH